MKNEENKTFTVTEIQMFIRHLNICICKKERVKSDIIKRCNKSDEPNIKTDFEKKTQKEIGRRKK